MDHVAYYPAASGNGPALEFIRLGIKAHEHVWLAVRFYVPNNISDGCNAVRLRLGPARRRPLSGDFACFGIQPAQVAARIIRVPHRIVWSDGDAPWPRIFMRQNPFMDLQRIGINAGDLIAPKFAED